MQKNSYIIKKKVQIKKETKENKERKKKEMFRP